MGDRRGAGDQLPADGQHDPVAPVERENAETLKEQYPESKIEKE